jgi:hypothetical protein
VANAIGRGPLPDRAASIFLRGTQAWTIAEIRKMA